MKQLLIALTACAVLGACSSSRVRYDDPAKVETVNIDFGSTDLQQLAGAMVRSMLDAPALARDEKPGPDDRIIVYAAGVNNRTSEHIDTSGIQDKIRTALLQSGRFRLAATQQGQDELAEQVRFQQGSGRVDPAQANAFGRQIGADTVLHGTLRSIEKGRKRNLEDAMQKTEDVYYQFVLELTDIETGEVIWINEKEIRKTKKTGIFGA